MASYYLMFCFFFSSRRRHTRLQGDWSSDVCSSDLKAAAAENYPFCTVEPNVGVVAVPDPRLDRLFELVQPKKKVPAVVEFVDIAGLVKGASQGEGLGNQFLSHIREVDAVVHVIRCFEDPDVVHVMGPVDPVRDHDVVPSEPALADPPA